ncbi:excalibur calcium-binding domain-containing protein [Leptolyngbya sp. CCNP1308]|uniref:excalibur calcium-binding domain-containing protein n=1 Tax=Leptolyngbya sp. CCNP1308 TaxID=3110255 RepID=UPI002B20A559|nr:excalibur calcium-binding domain-containing protein [Leptolyngbya sp. CCNP1308]MEA5449434.1 excalibur calcium-binding domain-containing protein [Leptolyngbya sp. CCNP1308]
MIRSIASTAALIGVSLLLPTAARADYSNIDHYCYMVDGTGAVVDLNHFCLRSTPELAEIASVEEAAPITGQVCADFASWGEAQHHFEAGTAPSRLDGDNDGIACEELKRVIRSGGNSIFTNRNSQGDSIQIMRESGTGTEHYLQVTLGGIAFTSKSFPTQEAARDHMYAYYGDLI